MADSTGYSPVDSRFHPLANSHRFLVPLIAGSTGGRSHRFLVPLIAGSTGGKIPQVSGPVDTGGSTVGKIPQVSGPVDIGGSTGGRSHRLWSRL